MRIGGLSLSGCLVMIEIITIFAAYQEKVSTESIINTVSISSILFQIHLFFIQYYMGLFKYIQQLLRYSRKSKRLLVLSYAFLAIVLLFTPAHLFAQDIEINETNFPDPAFRSYVNSSFGKNGVLPASTTVSSISMDGLGIKDLTGLKFFPELTSLSCQNNPDLTSIDLSVVPKLQTLKIAKCGVISLDFTNNPDMTYINCAEMKTLTHIDVSKCSMLQSLYVGNNLLQSLDVTHNPQLIDLSIYKNKLTTIDLSKNTVLQKLWAFNNPLLTSLDLSNNTKLVYLSVNSNNMPKIDVSMLPQLQDLLCFGYKLTELDVTKNQYLINLSCYTNSLTQLDLTNNAKLQTLLCFNNKLTELDLSKNTALTGLSCYSNKLTALNLTNNTALTHLDCHGNQLTSLSLHPKLSTQMVFLCVSNNALASIDLSNFTQLKETYQTNTFAGASAGKQHRRMMFYTDGTDAYLRVGSGIDASKISDAKLNVSGNITDITFSVGQESDGLVPLKFTNGSVRKRLFNWASTSAKATPITITYNYDTGASLSYMKVMDVTDTVECYLLPMSQEYGTVNLPYDAVLPTGATAYAISATHVTEGSHDNTATLTEIAKEGEIVAANTPMLIRRSADTYTLFALNQSTGTAKTAETNLLKGTKDKSIQNSANYYVLGLNNNTNSDQYNKLGFWRTNNSKIGNWRAYLDLTGTTSNAKGFILSWDTFAPTGISQVETTQGKVNTPWYTLDGRELGTKPSQRGVYIHNGKKVIISNQ